MSVDFRIDDKEFRNWVSRARRELSPAAQDAIVEKTAHTVRLDLVEATPGRSGGTRQSWAVTGSRGQRQVINTSPVMGFLEYGTPRKNPGAKIYPKNAKVLAWPKVAAGQKTSMTQTVRSKGKRKPGSAKKFIFAKWVHGMKPKRIVGKYFPRIGEMLIDNVKQVMARL